MNKSKLSVIIIVLGLLCPNVILLGQEAIETLPSVASVKTPPIRPQADSANKELDEVVVVGYGTQKKANVTGAVSSLKADEFKDQPVSNLASSLQGKMTGINVSTPSGTPGAGLLVAVRGANNPLYVVDGVPMLSESNSQISTSFDANGTSVGSGQNLSSIADINPNDIESIEVLKDAAAASIYGARSANGVVLITTKKGKAGKTTYNFNYYAGVQTLRRKLPLMSSQQLYDYMKKAHANDKEAWNKLTTDQERQDWIDQSLLSGTDIAEVKDYFDKELKFSAYKISEKKGEGGYAEATWQDLIDAGYNYDWQDGVFNKPFNAMIHNAEISAKGGNEKAKFYISGGYFDQNGLIIENNFKRYTLKINTEFALNSKLKVGSNLTLTHTQNRRTFNDNTYSGVLTNAIPSSPLMPFYNPYDLSNGGYFAYGYGTGYFLTDNPIKTAKEIYGLTSGYRAFGNLFLEWNIMKNLKFKSSGAMDFSYNEDVLTLSNITTDASATGGKGLQANTNNLTLLNENTLDYTRNINGHNITVLLGQSVQSSNTNTNALSTVGFFRGSANATASSAAFTTAGVGTGNISWFVASFFGRVNYDYDGKYIVSLSLRTDGSSRFAADKRWGFFPALSAGWNLHRESFLANSKIITGLKVRGSIGVAGDQDITLNRYRNLYTPSGYNLNIAYSPSALADPSITWQKNMSYNVGLDFGLFKDKLSGSVEYYVAERTDILIPVPTSGVTGSPTIIKNAGTVQDQGVEIALNYLAYKNEDWKVNFSGNINFIRNEVKSLPVNDQLYSTYSDLKPSHILKQGYSVGSFWGIKSAGFDDNGSALFYNKEGKKVSYYEINYDRDAQVIGKARPDFFGGFGIDVSYKSIDLSIDFTYSYGNQVYNILRAVYDNGGYQKLSAPTLDAGEWTYYATTSNYFVEGTTAAPKASLIKRNYIEQSSTYVEDASFLRCKNINLSYTFRPRESSALKFIQSIRIYGQTQNLFVLTNYSGYDPEVSANGGANPYTAGVDYATYPQPTIYTLGLNIVF